MKLVHKTLSALVVGAMLGAGPAAQAATITFDALNSSVVAGQTIVVKLVGRDFIEGAGGTFGGGVSIAWDPTKLSLQAFDTSVFAGDQLLATSNTNTVVNNVAGTLTDLSVASFFDGVEAADFDIALLTFQALTPGVSSLNASIGFFTSGFENIWTDSDPFEPTVLDLGFGQGSVSVVPVPAAVWLFASALGALGIARRKMAA